MCYKVIVFDDEPLQAESLVNKLRDSQYAQLLSIEIVSDITRLKQVLINQTVDILFMDINIGEETSGIEFVQKFVSAQSSVHIIYVTGFDRYHSQVYRTPHVGFVMKPVKEADLYEALRVALEAIEKTREHPFLIKAKGRTKRIDPGILRYVESNRRILRLYYGNECIEYYDKLSEFMKRLPSCFVQCHKSYAVNMSFIDELTRTSVLLTTGEQVPVSQTRSRDVVDAFEAFVGRSY
ncbi:MAG: response regulator transcription factor [Atopobiaceae bacterium]|nr:response regulator transcription factor [Atopobiaceae bacterium]